MTLVLETLQTVINQPSRFIRQRCQLNLPKSISSFPFRNKQREAVELALSNAPVVAIAGTPASGKTEIALATLATAIVHRRSTLVIAPYASTFDGYTNLPLPPLQINDNQDYRQSLRSWILEQLCHPKLDFLPPDRLEDHLFEELQVKYGRQFWLNLLRETDVTKLTSRISQAIAETFPDIHPKRCELLEYRLRQSQTLLEQRERLYQDYTSLSEYAIEQILDASIAYIKAPILCSSDRLRQLGDRIFDLVIVEDSQYLNSPLLQAIALRANKIVLLGELNESQRTQNLFNRIFQNLLAAYRIQLTENYRLHPDLALNIFPSLYPSQPNPYTPPNSKHTLVNENIHHLTWHDLRNTTQIEKTLQESVSSHLDQNDHKICVFVTSAQLSDRLKQQLPELSSRIISNINQLRGQEYDFLWFVLDQNSQQPLSLSTLQIAFTRAKNAITIIGDWDYYQNFFNSLSFSFHFIRDIIIQEN